MEEGNDAEADLKAFLSAAIHAKKDDRTVDFSEKVKLDYSDELRDAFDAFDALTPGRKRGYVLHFSDAKQSKTRVNRIESCRSNVVAGKGLNES